MMRFRKFLALAMCAVLLSVFGISVYAEQSSDEWAEEVLDTVQDYTHGEVVVKYTEDSTAASGVYWDTSVDVLSKQVYLTITVDLPMGHVIYDDPNTPHIDGIRLNNDVITSYKVPIDYTQDVDYEIAVRTVYAEGVTGALAQMADGTFDWVTLLENPIGLLTAGYYILATLSVIIGIFAVLFGKSKKVKSADEISKKVQDTSEAAAMKVMEEKVVPIVTAFQSTAQALVKAFALTTSKSKEAPSALLDVLQKVSNTDAESAIEEAKKLIEQNRATADAELQRTREVLNNIAQTNQEVKSNETEQTEQTGQTSPIF